MLLGEVHLHGSLHVNNNIRASRLSVPIPNDNAHSNLKRNPNSKLISVVRTAGLYCSRANVCFAYKIHSFVSVCLSLSVYVYVFVCPSMCVSVSV